MSDAHLPPAIGAASEELLAALAQVAAAHPDVRLSVLETGVRAAVHAALPALPDGAAGRCPQCQHAATLHDWRPRQLLTMLRAPALGAPLGDV